MDKRYIVWLLLLLTAGTGIAQSPFETNWKKEIPYLGIGLGSIGAALYLNRADYAFTIDEISQLQTVDINALDRSTVRFYSSTADQWSNVLLTGSQLTPLLLLGKEDTRKDFGKLMILYGEAAAINFGFTYLAKSVFRRGRPFVYNEGVSVDMKLTRNARSSFFSGHTSVSAMNTFFAATVFSEYYPESPWKPIVWGAAVLVPAMTAYNRVKAGKHFPTDVIAGYLVGGGIGVLIPHLHKRKVGTERNVRLNLGYQSAHLSWKFQR